jgi:hypothetical protein
MKESNMVIEDLSEYFVDALDKCTKKIAGVSSSVLSYVSATVFYFLVVGVTFLVCVGAALVFAFMIGAVFVV